MLSRAQLVSTYALCGFSNIGSLGVTLGALGGMCPAKEGVFAKCAFRAVVAGSIACFLTACVAGAPNSVPQSRGRAAMSVAGVLASEVGDCRSGADAGCINLDDVWRLLNATSSVQL